MVKKQEMFCPVHQEISQNIRDIKAKQESRLCSSHEAQLNFTNDNIKKIEEANKDQWKAINNLRVLVLIGTGIMACIGSAFGNLVIGYFQRGGRP